MPTVESTVEEAGSTRICRTIPRQIMDGTFWSELFIESEGDMINDNVVFKAIDGYEGLYEVSNHGDIKSLGRYRKTGSGGYMQKERMLKVTKTTTGYYKIELVKNGIRKSLKVHRLVAIAFLPNPLNKPNINHKDGNPLNNHIDNLEWCTQKENVNHALEIGLKKTLDLPIEKINDLYHKENKTLKEIANLFGVSTTPVIRAMRKYGLHIRTTSENQIRYNITKGFILNELKTKSGRQIAREIGCSPSLISIYLKRIKERGYIYAK